MRVHPLFGLGLGLVLVGSVAACSSGSSSSSSSSSSGSSGASGPPASLLDAPPEGKGVQLKMVTSLDPGQEIERVQFFRRPGASVHPSCGRENGGHAKQRHQGDSGGGLG